MPSCHCRPWFKSLMEPSQTLCPPAVLVERLRAAQPWLRLVGILCWVAAGFLLAVVLLLLLQEPMGLASHDPEHDGTVDALAALVCAGLSLLHVYPAILLLRSARRIRLLGESAVDVAGALEAQRRLWMYLGICLIVALSLSALGVGALILVVMRQSASA